MRSQLEAIKSSAIKWALAELGRAPFCRVTSAEGKRRKNCYTWADVEDRLPTGAGIYAAYLLDADKPFYVGEARNLRQRVEYHFAESASARKHGTMKKVLRAKGFAPDAPTYTLVRLKHIEVPFGRKEIEEALHREFGINTGARRKAKEGNLAA